MNNKIVVILGPTSSGKTGLAVDLAYEFKGEIVSADSRQVYRGMDIGTGKDLGEYKIKLKVKSRKLKVVKIKHHLIDVVGPKSQFDLAKYQKLAFRAIEDILKRGKVPILAGGTGLYLQAIVDGYSLAQVKPDKKLRAKLEKKTAGELLTMLKKLDLKKAKGLNNSDKNNKRRLVRLIEVARQKETKFPAGNLVSKKNYKFLLIGLAVPKEVLHKRIYKRLINRLEKEGMVEEVKRLKKQGVSWKRLEDFGLEYKYVSWYLRGRLDYDDMVEKLNIAIRQYAKKQMTWFRRWDRQGAKINWMESKGEVKKFVRNFYLR